MAAVQHQMRSNLVLNEGRFLGEENVENVVGEGGVGCGYLGFDASLDGGFDLGGGGYVSGWIESFEHVERWRLLLGVGLEVVLVCLSYSSSVVVGVGLNRVVCVVCLLVPAVTGPFILNICIE